MRDATIMAMQAKATMRDGLLLAQFEFLKTRQHAAELIFKRSRWIDRLRWALKPAEFLHEVDQEQQRMLQEADRKMAEAKAKAKIQVVPAGAAEGLKVKA